jgi:hypothetical protein
MDSKAEQYIYRALLTVIGLICFYYYFSKFFVVRVIAENYFPEKPHPIKWQEIFFCITSFVFVFEAIFLVGWNQLTNLRKKK